MFKKNIKKNSREITRREFIGSAAATAAAFTIIPRSVLGASKNPAPNDKVNLAFIGTGAMGMGNLNECLNLPDVEVVAVCDVAQEVDYNKEFKEKAGLNVALETVKQHYAERTKAGSNKFCAGLFYKLGGRGDFDIYL